MDALIGKASVPLAAFLSQPQTAKVLLVTSKGIYLEIGQRICILCPEKWGQIPIGISLNDLPALRQDQVITIGGGMIEFSGVRRPLDLTAYPDTFNRERRFPDWRQGAGVLIKTEKQRGLVPLAGPLLLDEPADQLNPYCQIALPAISSLLGGMHNGDIPLIRSSARQIMGSGIGLTPSGDDLLCGLLYVLLRSPFQYCAAVLALSDIIGREAGKCTNAVSAAYLTAIAGCEEYQRMSLAMCGQWEAITEIGSTSGCEMLLGMLTAEKWIQKETGVIP